MKNKIPQKILVVGESNSVLKMGWVHGLSGYFNSTNLINLSIGSTGIFNAIRVLKGGGIDGYNQLIEGVELLIIDSFIQDATFFADDTILYKKILGSVFSSFNEKFKCPIAYLAFENQNSSD